MTLWPGALVPLKYPEISASRFDAVCDGLAHPDIVERLDRLVEHQVDGVVGDPVQHRNAVRLLQPVDNRRRLQGEKHIDLAVLQRDGRRRLVLDDAEGHGVEARRVAEVVLVGDHADLVAGRPLVENERPGADRLHCILLVADFGHRLARCNPALVEIGKLVQQACIGRFQDDLHSERIGRLYRLHACELARVAALGVGVQHALQRKLHIIRSELAVALVEHDTVAKLEGVLLAIRRYAPACGEIGQDLVGGLVVFDHAVIDVARDRLVLDAEDPRGVQVADVGPNAHTQFGCACRGVDECYGHDQRQRTEDLSHDFSPLRQLDGCVFRVFVSNGDVSRRPGAGTARKAVQIADDRRAGDDIGVFRIHVEQVDGMGKLRAVGHAILRHDGPETARYRIAHSRAYAPAGGIADDNRGVHADPGQHRLQVGAVEGARELLHHQVIGRQHRQARVDVHQRRSVEEVLHQPRLLSEHPGVGKVRMVGDGREDDRGPDAAGRIEYGCDTRNMRIHVDIHLAGLGDAAAHVDDQYGRPAPETGALAEADIVVMGLLGFHSLCRDFVHLLPPALKNLPVQTYVRCD